MRKSRWHKLLTLPNRNRRKAAGLVSAVLMLIAVGVVWSTVWLSMEPSSYLYPALLIASQLLAYRVFLSWIKKAETVSKISPQQQEPETTR